MTADYPQVEIETSAGCFVVEVFLDESPQAAARFLKLAEEGGLAGAPFYRIVPGFVVQVGHHSSAHGDGPHFGQEEPLPSYYRQGVLATVEPGPTDTSEDFFICLHDLGSLPARHTIFGQVIQGFEVVVSIGKTHVGPETLDPPSIVALRVLER